MKKVSIIIPVFNTEKYIAKAVESIINQTYSNIELIIVDDASTDSTYQICENYAQRDNRIRLYKNNSNLGMMANWNKALDYVTGEYWGKLDADDWWDITFVEKCVSILDVQHETGMVCGRYVIVDENDNIDFSSEYQLPLEFQNQSTDFIWKVKQGPSGMFIPNLSQQGNGLIRTEVLTKLGKYTLLPAGDTEYYYRIGAHYKIFFIDELIHFHRVWSENFTRKHVLVAGKTEKNLFDVRSAIFDYYHINKLITAKEYRLFQKQNRYLYNRFLIADNRIRGNHRSFLLGIFENLTLFPFETLKFYFSRIFNRQ